MRRVLVCVAVIGTFAGCVSMLPRGFVTPEVSLVDVRLRDARLLETTLTCTVRVSNENDQPVVLDGAVHKVYLGDVYIGKGLTNQTVRLPRLATATYDVDVNVSNVRLLTHLQGLLARDKLNYELNSVLHLAAPRSARASDVNSGTLDLAAARRAAGLEAHAVPPPPPPPLPGIVAPR